MILLQHAELRISMRRLERNLRRMASADAAIPLDVRLNRDAARELCARVLSHMAFEERVLAPALEQLDAWGKLRAERLRADHEEQRAMVDEWLSVLDGNCDSGDEVAAIVQTLLSHLRRDMQEEEETLLRADLLVDVQLPTSVETG